MHRDEREHRRRRRSIGTGPEWGHGAYGPPPLARGGGYGPPVGPRWPPLAQLAKARTHGDRTGLGTLVAHAVNYVP